MNYKRIHDNIIERAGSRTLDGYGEWHHIKPRCMGGSDNRANKVHLTPEEHYVIHQLLVKMYPNVQGLVYAAHMMTKKSKTNNYRNNKEFGWIRRKMAKAISHRMLGSKNPRYKLGAGSGKNHPMYGRYHSESSKKKMARSHEGLPGFWTDKKLTNKHKKNLSNSHKGIHAGKNHPMYGKRHTDTAKEKLREANVGLKWYTNGIYSIRINPTNKIPKGFRRGRH